MPEEKKGADPEKVGDEAKAAPAAVPAASPKNGKPGKKKSLCDRKRVFIAYTCTNNCF